MELKIEKSFVWDEEVTGRVRKVCRMFGLTVDRLREKVPSFSCEIKVDDGDIVYITGPSGSGKSVILGELEKHLPEDERFNLFDTKLSETKTVIDCVNGNLLDALRMLSVAGLGDVFCLLNKVVYLSDGQKWRYRLAKALTSGRKYVFADEYCSGLDRISAAVVSYKVRRFAKERKVTFFLASSQEDILGDLQPDVMVRCALSEKIDVIYKERQS